MSAFTEACIAALEEDLKSEQFSPPPAEFQIAIKVFREIQDSLQELQVAIGIYNWIVSYYLKPNSHFSPINNHVEMFLLSQPTPNRQNFIKKGAISCSDLSYLLEWGKFGVIASPFRFFREQDWGLTHIQQILFRFAPRVFQNDVYKCYCFEETYKNIKLVDIKNLVADAVKEYIAYHENSDNADNRGLESGFFSRLRHTKKGISIAQDFNKSIQEKTEISTAITELKNFLENPARTYHNHSFTSYLADALARNRLVTSHKKEKYIQACLVEELNHGISMVNRSSPQPI